MTFLVKSKLRTATALVVGVILLLMTAAWGYFISTGRFAVLFADGSLDNAGAVAVMLEFQLSLLSFFVSVVLLLLAALGLMIVAENTRRKNLRRLMHWMRHRGCDVDEKLDLIKPDEGIEKMVSIIESMFPRPEEDSGTRLEHKEHVEDLKSRFLEIITHQLQTPLTSIRWNLESLLRGELGPLNLKQRDLLSITDKNYEDILVMLSDWVEALDVERGFLRMNMEPLVLSKFIDLVVRDHSSQSDLKNIKLKVKLSRTLPNVRADKGKLVFILKKLIHNAITYTPEGGQVLISARREGDYVKIVIEDSGVGIPYEEQQHIFQKFFRATNATLIEPNASGVGLFVTKTLVEALGGHIGFESEEGNGTSFTFTLPAVGPVNKIKKSPRRKKKTKKK